MTKWRDDLGTSAKRFIEIVWPEIGDWFGGEIELISAEGVDADFHQILDREAGIDFWAVEHDAGVLSIASRVQTYDYTTFTVRYSRPTGTDTEYQKRVRQLDSHHELPTYTVQAYVDADLGMLRNAAWCRTEDLIRYVSNGTPGDDWPIVTTYSGESFIPIEWGELDPLIELHVHNRERAGLEPTGDTQHTEVVQ